MSKPAFVFAHGAWHSGNCWQPVIQALELHGYDCLAIDLHGTIRNPDDKPTDAQRDVNLIRQTVLTELDRGNNVVLVCHSWGGIPGTSAVRDLDARARRKAGFDTSVVSLVAIASFFVLEGENLAIFREFDPTNQSLSRRVVETGLAYVEAPGPAHYFYHDLSVEDAEKWAEAIHPQSLAALLDTCKYSSYSEIPTHYLICTQDRAMAPNLQRWLVQRIRDQGCAVRTEEIDASHSPFLSQVEKTADFLRRCGGG